MSGKKGKSAQLWSRHERGQKKVIGFRHVEFDSSMEHTGRGS